VTVEFCLSIIRGENGVKKPEGVDVLWAWGNVIIGYCDTLVFLMVMCVACCKDGSTMGLFASPKTKNEESNYVSLAGDTRKDMDQFENA
jgi:hypothetical protein